MKSQRSVVMIATSDGRKPVLADCVRLLALHKADIDGWTITHSPTGRRIIMVDKKPAARDLMERLAVLDWDFTDPNGSFPETRQKAVRIVEEFARDYGAASSARGVRYLTTKAKGKVKNVERSI